MPRSIYTADVETVDTLQVRNTSGTLIAADSLPTATVAVAGGAPAAATVATTATTGIYTITHTPTGTEGDAIKVVALVIIGGLPYPVVVGDGQLVVTADTIYVDTSESPATINDCVSTDGTSSGSGNIAVYIYANSDKSGGLRALTTTAADGTYTVGVASAGTYYAFYYRSDLGLQGPDTVTAS